MCSTDTCGRLHPMKDGCVVAVVDDDVKNDFLHSDLTEEMYLEQPPRFVTRRSPNKGIFCRFKKSLYGLKQYPKTCFGHFSSMVLEFSLQQLTNDHSIFYRYCSVDCILLILVLWY
ncbi:Belongs to the helicase [Dionaea muscipula]